MLEFWLSTVLMIPIFFTLKIFQNYDEPGAYYLLNNAGIVVLSIVFAFTSWGKDAGKLKITKLGSAILVKVIALLFPFGTWILSLLVYPITYAHPIPGRTLPTPDF